MGAVRYKVDVFIVEGIEACSYIWAKGFRHEAAVSTGGLF